MDYQSSTNQKILGEFVARDVTINASQLVTDLLGKGLLEYEDIENYYQPCGECVMCRAGDFNHCEDTQAQEIYEWWFVTKWLYKKLKSHSEPVIYSPYGYLWGRCATGQAILLDGVIGRIAEDMEILEGQQNDWSKQ
jgi:hypothetical protein